MAGIVLLGDSITADGDWPTLLPGMPVRNAGVGGDTIADALARVEPAVSGGPAQVLVLLGTNDVGAGEPEGAILERYGQLLDRLAVAAPQAEVVVHGVLPREPSYASRLARLNEGLSALADRRGLAYLDPWPRFVGPDGGIRAELTSDGLHLSPAGYRQWADALRRHLTA